MKRRNTTVGTSRANLRRGPATGPPTGASFPSPGQAMKKTGRPGAHESSLRDARRQAVNLSRAVEVTTGFLEVGQRLPLLLQPLVGRELDPSDWAQGSRDFLD